MQFVISSHSKRHYNIYNFITIGCLLLICLSVNKLVTEKFKIQERWDDCPIFEARETKIHS